MEVLRAFSITTSTSIEPGLSWYVEQSRYPDEPLLPDGSPPAPAAFEPPAPPLAGSSSKPDAAGARQKPASQRWAALRGLQTASLLQLTSHTATTPGSTL